MLHHHDSILVTYHVFLIFHLLSISNNSVFSWFCIVDIWTRRVQETEHDGDSESDEVSDNTPSPADPRDDTQLTQLEQFQIGQIYYSSIAKQFHVYPNRELSDVEINVAV